MDQYLSRNVLVADDDKAMRVLFVKALTALGVENVAEAADGDEALTLFQKDEFNLILLDWDMPGKTGLEVLQAIRAKPSDLPVIMVTAERAKERVIEAAEAGVTDYLVKPVDLDGLKGTLAKYCQRKVNTAIYRCRNMMNSDVISINPDATIEDAIALLLQHNISGLPVVDDQNVLLGIVTEYSLMRSIRDPDLKAAPVKNVMSTPVMTVDEDTIPLKVVSMMEKQRIRRIPVVRDDKLVGVIARRDLLRYVTENEEVLRVFLDELQSLAAKETVNAELSTEDYHVASPVA